MPVGQKAGVTLLGDRVVWELMIDAANVSDVMCGPGREGLPLS